MRLNKFLVPTAAILMLSFGNAIAFAAPKVLPQRIAQNTEAPQGHKAQYWDRFMQELNLTPDQVQKVQTIRAQYKDQIAQRRQELVQAKKELQDLMASTASDDQIREKHSQVEDLEQKLRSVMFDQMLAFRQVLTPEQRTQAAEIMQKRHQAFKNNLSNQSQQQQQ
jgi:Spy/CpxP family protein refolding chaperone